MQPSVVLGTIFASLFCKRAQKPNTGSTPSEPRKRDCKTITRLGFLDSLKKMPKWPPNIWQAWAASRRALARAEELFPRIITDDEVCYPTYNGPGDSFRHCLWACLMARQIGLETAQDYVDYREIDSENPCNEAISDDFNNQTGIALSVEDGDCDSLCQHANLDTLKEEGECFSQTK